MLRLLFTRSQERVGTSTTSFGPDVQKYLESPPIIGSVSHAVCFYSAVIAAYTTLQGKNQTWLKAEHADECTLERVLDKPD